jgi:hypothetical protein
MVHLKQHKQLCVSLRDEAFSSLIKNTLLTVSLDNGSVEHGHVVPDNPDVYNGFVFVTGGNAWTGGGATMVHGTIMWHIFTSNGVNSGWFPVNSIRPTGMADISVCIWRETLVRTLHMFFSFGG